MRNRSVCGAKHTNYYIYLFSSISYCRGHSSLSRRSFCFYSFLLISLVRKTKSMTMDINVPQPEGKYRRPMNWRNYRNAIKPNLAAIAEASTPLRNALTHFVDSFETLWKRVFYMVVFCLFQKQHCVHYLNFS